MTGAEICLIIEQSAKSSVRLVEVPGLRLEFGETRPASPAVTTPPTSEITRPAVAALTDSQHEKQQREATEVDEAFIKERRLALMLIEDPLEYERLIQSGELSDFEGDKDDDTD